jgi:hypothetical protein
MPDDNAVQLNLDEQLIANSCEEEEAEDETNDSQETESDQ